MNDETDSTVPWLTSASPAPHAASTEATTSNSVPIRFVTNIRRGEYDVGSPIRFEATVRKGLIGLGTVGVWYVADMGWTGSGSTIVSSRRSIALAAFVAALCVLAGAATILIRRDVVLASLGGVLLLATVIALPIAVILGIHAYPQVESAVIIAHGGANWRTRLPVTEVFGVRTETDRTLTLEGRADRRACAWQLRSVTIDLASGDIVDVVELPTSYPSGAVPPPLTPIDPNSFEVTQGSAPFICPN